MSDILSDPTKLAPGDETPEAAAARWFARRRSGDMTTAETEALEAWLAADPAHRALLDQSEYWWGAASALRSDPTILALREDVARGQASRRRRRWVGGAMAASLVVAAATALMSSDIATPAFWPGARHFVTEVGQTSTVKLRDGSTVTLDTDSAFRANLTADVREIRLERGQAFFKVAKDSTRPFRVIAGDKIVTATGTAFSVRVQKNAVNVTLVEGRVRVEERVAPVIGPRRANSEPATDMIAGTQLVAVESKSWNVAPVDTGKATSWMDGQLVFEARAIGDVAAELNRYSEKKIVISDPALARTPITGAFATGDVPAFVSAVQSYRLARVVSDGRGEVTLARYQPRPVSAPGQGG